ncbi:hypothetical protein E4A51_15400 [Cellulomonas sp. HD19AZ1]|nr:hypothetical protein E4A51_15400 [Cellulomonas sp. HD19AZ1]
MPPRAPASLRPGRDRPCCPDRCPRPARTRGPTGAYRRRHVPGGASPRPRRQLRPHARARGRACRG